MRIENIARIVMPAIVLGACATGRIGTARASETRVSLNELAADNSSAHLLAAVEDPRLPDADESFLKIRDEAGDEASAMVELCVAPDGHVDRVELKRHSASSAYDRAVLKDVADWQFGGEKRTRSDSDICELATITYDLPL